MTNQIDFPLEPFEFYYNSIMAEIQPKLIGPEIMVKGEVLPPGTLEVTRDIHLYPEGTARRGNLNSPVPRVSGELTRKTIPIVEHISGFTIPNQSLLASKRGITPLPVSMAVDCARLVAESIEDMIFNGIPEKGVKGIYKDAGDTHTIEEGKQWNLKDCDPYNDIIDMVSKLESTGRYTSKKMVLDPIAYRALARTNNVGVSYLKMIADAGIFPNGLKDIYTAPARANNTSYIIPPGSGVICDFGNNIAERYVQEPTWENAPQGGGLYEGEISLKPNEMNDDHLWPFTVQTYQGIDIHYPEAFLKLEGLIKTPASEKKKGN
jgi:hypothetical protein